MNTPDNSIESNNPVTPAPEKAIAKPRKRATPKLVPDAGQNPKSKPSPKPRAKSTKKPTNKKASKHPVVSIKHRLIWNGLEVLGFSIAAVSAIMVLLGYSAKVFSGTSFLKSLLPFAVGILALIIATAGLLIAWWTLRKWLKSCCRNNQC